MNRYDPGQGRPTYDSLVPPLWNGDSANLSLALLGLETIPGSTLNPLFTTDLVTGASRLRPGDADMDLDFDQFDLAQAQASAKYLSGLPATWGEGDWDGGPGGQQGQPPAGNGLFDETDVVAALAPGHYLAGANAAILGFGQTGDRQTSVGYDAHTGEVWVDAPAGTELTSVNIESAAGIFTGQAASHLGGSFDNDSDQNIFKATFGSSFGSLSFGNVARTGLSQAMLQDDLTVVGSLAGGGALGNVDLIYVPVPEPSGLALLVLAVLRYASLRCAPAMQGGGPQDNDGPIIVEWIRFQLQWQLACATPRTRGRKRDAAGKGYLVQGRGRTA